jgi:hypothetical protein
VKFSVRDLLILVKVTDGGIQLTGLRICLLRQLLRLPGLSAGLQCLLVRRIRSRLRLMNSCLGPSVYILDVVCVLCL